MTFIFKITSVAMVTLFLSIVIKQYKQEYALAVGVSGSAVILFLICENAIGYVSILKGYLSDSGVSSEAIGIVIKAVGIGYITEFSAATAKDFGQISLCAKIVFAGKTAVLILSLPLLKQLTELALSFIL